MPKVPDLGWVVRVGVEGEEPLEFSADDAPFVVRGQQVRALGPPRVLATVEVDVTIPADPRVARWLSDGVDISLEVLHRDEVMWRSLRLAEWRVTPDEVDLEMRGVVDR